MYTKHTFKSDKFFNFNYVQYLPKGYDPNKKYPLVFFLHGAGERGDDLDVAMRNGYMKHVRESGKEYPFIFVGPQCPFEKYWGCYTESLLGFLDYIMETLPIDEDRVYLTGLSMGGTGTFMLAMAAPDRFAALAPVCGTGIYWHACVIRHIPIYIYHGDCDDIVPLYESTNMLRALNSGGGTAKIKVLHGEGHGAWEAAYSDDELLEWMLSQKRKQK